MGVSGLSGLSVLPFGRYGRSFDLDLALATFTPSLAKRASGVFAAAPIVQGAFDGSGTPDKLVTDGRGGVIGNPRGRSYSQTDIMQGTVSFWWTPEKDRDATQTDDEYLFWQDAGLYVRYEHDNGQVYTSPGGLATALNTVAGTTYHVVFRWSRHRPIDGTNFASLSINGVHAFGIPSEPSLVYPDSSAGVGCSLIPTMPANGLIEGLHVSRRVWTDGDYGDYVGVADEIADVYAAGAGADPSTVVGGGGSWDTVLCLPTNSAVGALATGSGEAWSHPILSQLHEHSLMEDGGYLGGQWGVYFDGVGDEVDFGSDATLDDIPSGASITVEGWFRIDADAAGRHLIGKGNGVGWWLFTDGTSQLGAIVYCATTNAQSLITAAAVGLPAFADGKVHHISFVYDDTGDRTVYISVDGRWASAYATQVAGVGAYDSDAADNLYTGEHDGSSSPFQGAHGWLHLSSVRRYTPGTDFDAPRILSTDGNTIEAWTVDQGTGNLTASVTSPNNDGVRTGAVWEAQWDQDGSPVIPCSILFAAANQDVNYGSDATIDDIPSGASITVEGWFEVAVDSEGYRHLVGKGAGWWMLINNSGQIEARVYCATTNAWTSVNASAYGLNTFHDGRPHHFAFVYDDTGDRKAYISVDGIWPSSYVTQQAGVGAYVTDASDDLYTGQGQGTLYDFLGIHGWIRLSNSRRYTPGSVFCPDDWVNPPGIDGNTIEQWNVDDGAGAVTAQVTSPNNDGTITGALWQHTPDRSYTYHGGKSFYPWGYVIGSDGASDGIQTIVTGLTPGDGYVVRAVIGYDQDKRAEPAIRLYDNIGAAQITQLVGPRLHGTHDGGNNQANLGDSGARWPQSLVGGTVYNITDGSSAAITAISGDGQTCTTALAGGTDNDWDNGDEYMIVPPYGPDYAWVEMFCFTLPAGCTSLDIQIRNLAGEGVMYIYQIEVLENLLINGDHENLTGGNPDLITGWTNSGLDPGDTQASSGGGGIVHSGAEALQWNAGAVASEGLYYALGVVAGDFVCAGGWLYSDGSADMGIGSTGVANMLLQVGVGVDVTSSIAKWTHVGGVWRAVHATLGAIEMHGDAQSPGYSDDVYAFKLDDVTITCTPASQANSAENGGLRVDGRDTLTQPIPAGSLGATAGHVRWRARPRHADGDYRIVEEVAVPCMAWLSAPVANYIAVDLSATNTLRLEIFQGGAASSNTVVAPGLVADTEYLFELIYDAVQIQLLIDGVPQITVAPGGGIDFLADIPTAVAWGHRQSLDRQMDAVLINP